MGTREEAYPFSIAVCVHLVRFVEIHAIETADGEREDDLNRTEDRVGNVAHGHFAAFNGAHGDVVLD
jgi:hypothetical protein